MRPHMCRFVPCDERLSRLPDRDTYEIMFRFDVTPAEFFGQPDEAQHTARETVRITVTGPSFFEGGIPKDPDNKLRVLYWHAVKTLERGEASLCIDSEYAEDNRVDAARVTFPPTAPFLILRQVKMGFQP